MFHGPLGSCHKSNTVVPKTRLFPRGRPIGRLVAWLLFHEGGDAAAHAEFAPSKTQRKMARALFRTLPGSDHFIENEKSAGSESEEPDSS